MPKVWTDEEVQAEIKAAHDIWASDYEKATYTRLKDKFDKPTDPKNPNDPPRKQDPPANDPPKTKKSIWWGEMNDE